MKRINLFCIVVMIHLSASTIFAGHFSFKEPNSIDFMVFWVDVFTIDGETSEIGDEIAIFDKQGTICGHYL
jgi:hypothetical protein